MEEDFDYLQMLQGELYLSSGIHPEHHAYHGRRLVQKINQIPIDNRDEIVRMEKELFGATGENIYVTPPFNVDYGRHVFIGENFYCNVDCFFLDVNEIRIGDNVMIGPRVGLYTAGHPTDPTIRNTGLEFGLPITIEDNVWIGGSAVILPGITIGENSIVAAGSVVTKNVPANIIVGGNPAKILRSINEQDYKKWSALRDAYFEKKENF